VQIVAAFLRQTENPGNCRSGLETKSIAAESFVENLMEVISSLYEMASPPGQACQPLRCGEEYAAIPRARRSLDARQTGLYSAP